MGLHTRKNAVTQRSLWKPSKNSLTMCQGCMRKIADIDDFKTADGVEILSK